MMQFEYRKALLQGSEVFCNDSNKLLQVVTKNIFIFIFHCPHRCRRVSIDNISDINSSAFDNDTMTRGA